MGANPKRGREISPRGHTAHWRGLDMSAAQRKLLRQSHDRRHALFRRNEQGRPVSGTFSKSLAWLDRIMASDLPRQVKLRELDEWANLMSMHRIFREKEAHPGTAFDRHKMLEEIHSELKKKYGL